MPGTGNGGGGTGGMSVRVVVLALVLVVLIAPAAFYGEILFGTTYMFGAGVPGMAPLAILFLLAALNPLWSRARGLSRRELLAVYGIIVVGAPLVTHGILVWGLSTNISHQYLARAMPEWETTFLQHLPAWFSPTDSAAVEDYFQGRASVPWQLWASPAVGWGSYMLALFTATLCLILLLRRQWISHERLAFPLAQVPLELVQGEAASGAGRLPVGWVFWIGFLLSFGLTSVSRLSGIFPAVPDIPLSGVILMQWQRVGPLAGLGAWELWLAPWMIAVAYLIPKELSFSCWFFWVVRIGLTVAAIAAGATPTRPEEWWSSTFPAPTHQGGGAVLAVAAWAIWVGRHHLARALRLALGLGGHEPEEGEPVAYRWALLGFALSFGYLLYFYWAAGTRIVVGAAIAGLIIVHYVVWARLRAETGLGFVPFPLSVNGMMVVPFGSAIFRPREIVALFSTRWSYFPGFGESFEVCTGNSLESFKIADAAGISSRRLLHVMVAGFAIALVIGIFVVITGMYHYGFLNTRAASSGWLSSQLRSSGGRILEAITNPSKRDLNGTIAMGAGAVVTLALGLLRLRFWWWPFHPIGYLAANCWGMHWFAQPFFLGWLLKSLVIRYGGLPLYRRTFPLAIGLIIGDFVSQGAWVFVISILRGAGVDV